MLKFTRQQRSTSAERNVNSRLNQRVTNSEPVPASNRFQRTNTREFSPARQLQRNGLQLTPRRNSSSLERPKTRRQLNFTDLRDQGGFVSPRDISYNRQIHSPPVVRTAKFNTKRPNGNSDLNAHQSSPTLGPLTPTLEKLSSPHVTEGVKPTPLLKSVLKSDFHRAVERLVEKLDLQLLDTSSESGYGSDDHDSLAAAISNKLIKGQQVPPPIPSRGRGTKKKVQFDSYVLLLQGLRENNLEMVQKHVQEVCAEALTTDEVLTEMMKSVIEGNEYVLRELLIHGADPNYTDPCGLTPLHLAATFNNLSLVKILLDFGAAIFARAHSSGKIPSELCSPRFISPNGHAYQACLAYLRCMEECLGVANGGVVYVARPYRTSCRNDELCVQVGQRLNVIRKGDYQGSCWWWCRKDETGEEGYVLRDLLALRKPENK